MSQHMNGKSVGQILDRRYSSRTDGVNILLNINGRFYRNTKTANNWGKRGFTKMGRIVFISLVIAETSSDTPGLSDTGIRRCPIYGQFAT